jgi:hypothetical protein
MATNPSAATSASLVPWLPADQAMLLASEDPYTGSVNSSLMAAGTIYLTKLPARQAFTLSNVLALMPTPGVGASTGSFAGIYSAAGTLLAQSADAGALFTGAAGLLTIPLTSSAQVPAGGFVWAALLANLATTQPTLSRASGFLAAVNAGLATAVLRFCVNGTGATVLPGSITPASNSTGAAIAFWAGAS